MEGHQNNDPVPFHGDVDPTTLAALAACPEFPQFAFHGADVRHADIQRTVLLDKLNYVDQVCLDVLRQVLDLAVYALVESLNGPRHNIT